MDLYLVGEAYFVVDGHHRISVARSLSADSIEAWVKEFPTPAKVAPESSLKELILEQEKVDLLRETGLEAADADDYRVTIAGGYDRLLDHVQTHRYFLGVERSEPPSMPDAVDSWRDTVYAPVVEVIRQHEVLEHFPENTETDLYLFVMDHLHHLREVYGAEAADLSRAVEGLQRKPAAGRRGPSVRKPAARMGSQAKKQTRKGT